MYRTACTSVRFVSGICVFVDPDLVFSDNLVNLNFRWVGYLEPAWRGCRNMERIRSFIFGFPAALSRDDRLHCADDRLRCRDDRLHAGWTAHSGVMKTVVMGIFCAPRGKHLRKCFLKDAGETFWKGGFDSFFLVYRGVFYNIPQASPRIFADSVSGRSLLKINLIVIPCLLYGFSKYPLVWIETVVHEIGISTLYILNYPQG